MNKFIRTSLGLAACGAATLIAYAAVTFDPDSGEGFVGKGDVQFTFGWNNKALQENAALVEFRVKSEVVTEVSWVCTNSNNEHTQPRERTTTTTIEGLFDSIAREKNQITGFLLQGYAGDVDQSSETEGPAINSCPSGPWTLTTPAGDPQVVSSGGGGVEVSADGGSTWTALLSPL